MIEPNYHLLTLSAKNPTELRRMAERLVRHLQRQPQQKLADLSYTYQVGKRSFAHRIALVTSDSSELEELCQKIVESETFLSSRKGVRYADSQYAEPKVVFLFTGQGSQYTGMGRSLYQSSSVFKQVIDRCALLLEGYLQRPLHDYLFNETCAEELNDTRVTQPAIFALEYALAQLWMSWGIYPDAMIGHSLGEYVAACIGGAVSLEEVLPLIAERGRLMHELCEPGAMASVLAPVEHVQTDIAPYASRAEISAVNGENHVVIAGTVDGVEELVAKWQKDGLTAKRLTVSHAFHSRLMEPMLEVFYARLSKVEWKTLEIPLVSNLTGELMQGIPDADYWCRHLRQPVQFQQGLRTLEQAGFDVFLEVGPHPVLHRLVQRDLSGDRLIVESLDRHKPDWQSMLETVGALWSRGLNIDWTSLHRDHPRRRVHVPTYPFAETTYNIAEEKRKQMQASQTEYTVSSVVKVNAHNCKAQQALMKFFSDILGVHDSGPEDNFFDLGGDSLNAIQLQERIRTELGVDITLLDLYNFSTLADLAAEIERRRPLESDACRLSHSIPKVPKRKSYPLAPGQKRLYFLAQMQSGTEAYNLPTGMHIRGPLRLDLFQAALQQVVNRHVALRTTFQMEDGEPVQVIADTLTLECPVIDWTQLTSEQQDRSTEELMAAEAVHVFDLEKGPLIRVHIAKLQEEDHLVVCNVHHIVFDAWSMGVLLREVDEIYTALVAGQEPNLPPLAVEYTDYSVWINDQVDMGMLASSHDYWMKRLGGTLPVLDLPTDYPRPPIQSLRGGATKLRVDPNIVKALRCLMSEQNTTLYTVLLAAFQVLLHRWSGQRDFIVGTSVAGRIKTCTEQMIGMFVNTLAMRADLSEDLTFADFLAKVQTDTLNSFTHQDYPFEKLVEELRPERDESRTPIFNVLFSLVRSENFELEKFCGGRVTPVQPPGIFSKFDLTLMASEEGEDLTLHLDYCADLFRVETMDRLLAQMVELLRGITVAPHTKISELNLIPEDELRLQVSVFNDTAREFPSDKTVHALLAERANRCPDSIAVRYGLRTLTYGELEDRANRLARHLRALGVKQETSVAILAKRSPEMVVAILGVLKAGGTYVPIDPAYPQSRINYLLEVTEAPIAITQQELEPKLHEYGGLRILLDHLDDICKTVSGETMEEFSAPDSLAYIIFTSGSTGKPKGVEVKHRGVVNYLTWAAEYYDSYKAGSFPLYSSLAFDLTISSLFLPLLTGHTVYIQPAELEGVSLVTTMARSNDFQSAKFTPAHLELLVQDAELNGPGMSSLRHVIVGGEAISPELVKKWFHYYPETTLYNEYGPTETVVGCIVHKLTKNNCEFASSVVPIGRPIANTRIYLLDENLQLVPIGVKGEIYIGGAGVARGYHKRPDLTEERFLQSPFWPGEILYRTGDLARYLADGTIEYFGRLDHQVKIRGYRIELGEIEGMLQKHPMIRQAVVITAPDKEGQQQLVAYIVTTATLLPAQVKKFLAQSLPEYMIPTHVISLAQIPLTTNGKVDRSALPAPNLEAVGHDPVQPQFQEQTQDSELFNWVADLWKQSLGVESVDRHDDFFELGGHSLKILPIIVKIKSKFPTVQVQDFFTHRTLQQFVDHLHSMQGEPPSPFLVATQIQRGLNEPPTELELWIAELWKQSLGVEYVDLDDDFFELGGHSLKILPIIVKIKSKFPTVQVQDFFTHRTPRALAEHLAKQDSLVCTVEPTQVQTQVQVPTETSVFSAPAPAAIQTASLESLQDLKFHSPKAVLVTGCTGFLGSHVLHELLDKTDARVYALVRGRGEQSAWKRLEDTVMFYFGRDSLRKLNHRVTLVEGDIGIERFGLSPDRLRELEETLDTIIHCAADVRHYGDSASFYNTNVVGTERLLDIARSGKRKIHFHFVSTISIVGWSPNDLDEYVLTESEFDRGQINDNVYTYSKFEAEKRIRQSMAEGIPATIYRVGNLVGHSKTGQFQRNIGSDAFYRILKALILLEASLKAPGYIDLTPIDYASTALVRLVFSRDTNGKTYHLCNPQQITLVELARLLQEFGYSITLLNPEQFNKILYRDSMTEAETEALQLIVPHLEGSGNALIRIDAQQTKRTLEGLGVHCPTPDRELMYQILKYAIWQKFIPQPKWWPILAENEQLGQQNANDLYIN